MAESGIRESISILQVVEECKEGKISLKEVTLKDRKTNLLTTRYFWNRANHRGSLCIQVGDMTKPETSWPFLLREPSKHPDQGDDVATLGAFTAIPDPDEVAGWLWFREWQLQEIFAKKVVKGKKGETLDSVRTEVALIGIVPESEGQHFCFNQKLQPGGSIEALRTQASTVYSERVTDPTTGVTHTEYEQGPELEMHTLRPSDTLFTDIEIGELKKSQGKHRSTVHTRTLVRVVEKRAPVRDTTFRIGGVVVKRREAVAVEAVETVDDSLVGNVQAEVHSDANNAQVPVVFESTSSVNPGPASSRTFGDAIADDIARLSAATLKRPSASVTAPLTVPLIVDENEGGAAVVVPATKRARTSAASVVNAAV
jgi:hypothetical protein